MRKIGAVLEEELIFGALDRERRWRRIAYIASIFGFSGCLLAGVVATSVDKPAPVLVPFDIRNGLPLPNVQISSFSTQHKEAIIESMIYSYVSDRETYHVFDNDLRIETVKARSTGLALKTLISLWDSFSGDYLPRQYRDNARIDVAISSITLLSENRAQVRLLKRLTTTDGIKDNAFLVTLEYELTPSKKKSLEAVWKNPFGFVVKNYRVVLQQYGGG
ncbi:type IV secretion system protein [Brucella pituitosa]|uniref:type IV secretion system protein n=1 Tax=Brucella pituitosa TaxID=571256 RepID=UPI0009A17DE4|nr:type IV secretion system protein [Brucella pituitosa]